MERETLRCGKEVVCAVLCCAVLVCVLVCVHVCVCVLLGLYLDKINTELIARAIFWALGVTGNLTSQYIRCIYDIDSDKFL